MLNNQRVLQKKNKHIGIYSVLWLEGATVTILFGWSKIGDQPVKKSTPHIHFRRALKEVIQVGVGDDSTNTQLFNIH